MRLSESEERQLIIWENLAADEYLRRTQADEMEKMEAQVKSTNERYRVLTNQGWGWAQGWSFTFVVCLEKTSTLLPSCKKSESTIFHVSRSLSDAP